MDLFDSDEYTRHINDLLKEWHVPGLSIAIVQNDKIISKGYGYASLEKKKPCTGDTIYDFASCSKSLTAASVALMVANDEKFPQVKWDSKMCELLPEDFVMGEESYTRDVTVEDVLSHRTGLAAPENDFAGLNVKKGEIDSAKTITRNLRNLAISQPIRTKMQYCNLMFTVATHLVETLTTKPFAEILQEWFFKPLGMTSSHLQPQAVIDAGLESRLAIPYRYDDDTKVYEPIPWLESPEAQGAGSIYTSANDYVKYVKAIMNKEDMFTEEIVKGLTKPRIYEDDEDEDDKRSPMTSWTAYAAGWDCSYRGHKIISHDGLNYGYGLTHFFMPALRFGGVVVGNSGDANDIAAIVSRELMDQVLKVPQDERSDWNLRFRDDLERETEEEKQRVENLKEEMRSAGDGELEQKTPLSTYIGRYWNEGYKAMEVEIKDDQLFIDASDRSMGFFLTFEHICDDAKYVVHLSDFVEGGDDQMAAEFVFEGPTILKFGLSLEEDLDEMIWFDKVPQSRGLGTRSLVYLLTP
ncbi:hypothetical protein LTR86_000022 [Recurvomyces mirabilis]|nr:hypothetical protein LTR86_000022 [Recurvomyces mirabilis]